MQISDTLHMYIVFNIWMHLVGSDLFFFHMYHTVVLNLGMSLSGVSSSKALQLLGVWACLNPCNEFRRLGV